jgi:hypothetical protein
MESSGYAAVLPDPSPALRIPLKTGLKAFGATIAKLKAELIIMNKQIFLSAAILSLFILAAQANPVSRRAAITGGGGNGRCTIEVSVDHAAEVEISGDLGLLTTTGGQQSDWRRFQCNAPLPRNPVDFRFIRIAGRGAARLVQDPRSTGGRAVIQINDPQGGRGGYTFDLQWRGPASGGWTPGPPGPPPGQGPGPGHWPGGFPMAKAIQACQDSVTDRLNRDGYSYVSFERTIPDNNPGRNDWVTGRVSAKRGLENRRFSFSCSVDFRSGRVRSVDVSRR